MGRSAVVIGGSIEGLGAACALAEEGWAVTLVERSSRLGGRFGCFREQGFEFESDPGPLVDPGALGAAFSRSGRLAKNYVNLLAVEARLRCFFADGAVVNLRGDAERMARILDQQFPIDAPGAEYEALMKLSARALAGGAAEFERSLAGAHPRVRGLFEACKVFGPGPGAAALGERGAAHAMGGGRRIVEALERLAGELGVEFEMGEEATAVLVEGGRAAGVALRSGERRAAAVVCAAGAEGARALTGAPAGPAQREVRIWLGLEGRLAMLGRYNAVLAEGGPIFIGVATRSDPACAPAGCENVCIVAPAGEGGAEWGAGEAQRARDEVFAALKGFGIELPSRRILFERVDAAAKVRIGAAAAPEACVVAAPSVNAGPAAAVAAGREAAQRLARAALPQPA